MPDLIIKLVRNHPDKTHIKFNPYKLYGRYPRKRNPKIKYITDQDEHYGIPRELLFIKIENEVDPLYVDREVCFISMSFDDLHDLHEDSFLALRHLVVELN